MACQKLQNSKVDACWKKITLHRILTSVVYVRHHHQIEHDGANLALPSPHPRPCGA